MELHRPGFPFRPNLLAQTILDAECIAIHGYTGLSMLPDPPHRQRYHHQRLLLWARGSVCVQFRAVDGLLVSTIDAVFTSIQNLWNAYADMLSLSLSQRSSWMRRTSKRLWHHCQHRLRQHMLSRLWAQGKESEQES